MFRRRGIARALLDGVVAYARASGAPGLEAYPVDPGGGRVNPSFAYLGLTPMFETAGFRRVTETAARSDNRPRVLMRLELAAGGQAEGASGGDGKRTTARRERASNDLSS